MSHLFESLKLGSLELRNRIVMAPMCMYSSDDTGTVKPFHIEHYATRAMGGVGLVIIEATAVEPRGRISAEDLGIWSDAHIEGLKTIVDAIHAHGAKAAIQLAHAGRKCGVLTDDVIAPSPVWYADIETGLKMPREMGQLDIDQTISAFREAARRAHEAGFDMIELHGAHGYLINQFISPLTNHRSDRYGFEASVNGAAFLAEVLIAVHETWPSTKPLALRVSAADYVEGGNAATDVAKVINAVKHLGLDLIHVSSGGVAPARFPIYDGYQTKLAEIIKEKTGLLTITGGRIKTAHMADEIIRNQRADMVFLGRQLLIDPYFSLRAAQELKIEIDYEPIQYQRWKTSL